MRWRQSFSTILVGKSILLREGLAGILHSADFHILASVSCADDLPASNLQQQQQLFIIVHTGDDFAAAIDQTGSLNKGSYGYRVTWQDDQGGVTGMEFTGDKAIPTASDGQSIQFDNLPATAGPKSIYRTDSSGKGDFRLVGTLQSGTQSSFVDSTADDARSQTVQNTAFSRISNAPRSFVVSLNNVGEVKPSGQAVP